MLAFLRVSETEREWLENIFKEKQKYLFLLSQKLICSKIEVSIEQINYISEK